jgi:hypothetical protein
MFCAKNTSRADSICNVLHRLERIWRRLPKPVFDSYRPESHYMRADTVRNIVRNGATARTIRP